MNKNFDAYEYVAVIAPGSIIAIGIFLQWPDVKTAILQKDFSLGDLGIFLICSYVLGHVVQAAGNLLEDIVFEPFGGLPTMWLLKAHQNLISKDQFTRLIGILAKGKSDFQLTATLPENWYSITREMYSCVASAGRSSRIDAFNRTYGLLRGITASLLLLTIWFLIIRWGQWAWPSTSFALALLTLFRMYRFAKTYARELFVEYIRISGATD